MANHVQHLLNTWYPQRDEHEWVLATIIATQGSSYRKSGAMMFINSLGQHFGLLSGGCLESDIMRQARRCWDTHKSRIIEYDMREEEDLAYRLGLGCGGLVRILLQPISASNDYLSLSQLRERLLQGDTCRYEQSLEEGFPNNRISAFQHQNQDHETSHQHIKVHIVKPVPQLAIFGAGVDAIPLFTMAKQLGWQVTLVDARPSNAKRPEFSSAKEFVKTPLDETSVHIEHAYLQSINAAVIMTHNVEMDALALQLCQKSSAKYVGLLGPIHRTDKVLQHLDISLQDLIKPLANPIGLQLGGELPESIALSILSEIHAFFEQADASSISGMLGQNNSLATHIKNAVSANFKAL